MKKILISFAILCGFFSAQNAYSQVTIASEGFENTLTMFSVTAGTASYYSGNSAGADGVATSPFASAGTYSLGKSNATLTITSSAVNTVGYTGISSSFRLASWSIGITTNGADAADIVTVEVSPDNGTNWYSTVRVLGSSANNAYWSYAGGSGNASTAYDGDATPVNFQPTTSGVQTTNGYSTVTVTGLPAASQLMFRITMVNNATAERWTIDDFKVQGTAPAGSNHTVTFTGSSTDFDAGEKFSAAANNTDYYITFDQTYMYFGAFRTSGTFGSGDNFAIYIDTDPRSTTTSGNGTTAGRNYNGVTPTLPFNADYTSYTEQSYTDPINRYNGSWATTGVTPTTSTSTTAREVRIALSDIGNPASVYVTVWMGYGGGLFSNAPGTNLSASATPTIAGFFGSFPVYKSGVNPTTYRSQNTSSANGGGTAISDLVLTSSGNIADDYGDITISNAAVGTVSVANASFTGSLTLSNTATVALGVNSLSVGGRGIGGTAGQIVMNNTSTTSIDGTSTVGKVAFLGAGLVSGSNSARTFGTNSTVQIAGGVDFTSSATNIEGNLQINNGGFVNTNVPTYGSASTLIYNSGSTYTAGVEWTSNATSGTGVPANVTIGNGANTTLSFGSSALYRAARGNVLIAASSGLTLSSASGGDLYVGGNFTNSGTFTHSSRAVFFNGTGTQTLAGTLNGSGTTNFFPYLFVTNTTGNVTCGVNINVGTSGQSSFTVAASGGLYTQTASTFTLVTGALGTVNGTFRNSGATITNTGTMTVSGTGTFNHNMNGGTIATCTWSSGSNCSVTGTTTTEPAGLGQSFSDFSWNCVQSAARNLSGALTTVGRDLNILGTNSQNLGLVASTGSLTLSIGRDLNISSGSLVGTTGTVTPTINITGDLNISGTGGFTISNSASSGAGTAAVTVGGNTSITSSSGTALVIAVSSSKSASLTCTGTFLLNGSGQIHMSQATNATPTGTLTVNGATTLTAGTMNVANTSANSRGTFNANGALTVNGGTLNISTLGIGVVNLTDNLVLSSGTISRTSGTSTFNLSKASGTQTVNQTSGTFSGVIGLNAGTGSTTNTVQLVSNLDLGTGTGVFTTKLGSTLDFQTYTVTGSGTCASASGSTYKTASQYGFTAATSGSTGGSVQTTTRTYHASASYTFNGSGTQGTGDFFGSTTPTANMCANLVIDNSSNVSLDANVSVQATTTLTNGHLTLGSNDILTGAISGAGSTKHFKTTGTGQLKQLAGTLFPSVLFPVGKTAYNPITINNTGGLSDTYGVRVIDAVTSPAANDATKLINRYWAVTEATAGTSTITASAQYNGGEENANFTAGTTLKMGLHNGTSWSDVNASSSGGGPYVVTNGSAFSPSVASYTIGVGKDDGFAAPNVSYTWTGATDNTWATATNWSPNGTPSISDDVLIDPANYTTALVMTDSRTVTNFTVQNSGSFTMNSGSDLTVTGNFNYTSTTAPSLNCSSTLTISGSTSQNIPAFNYGSLNLTGGARVLANSGTIGICGTYTPGSSMTVTGSTVNYNGTGAQTITSSTYNNLTISQNRGAATITLGSGTIDVAGTFDPSTASNYSVAVGTNTFNFSSVGSQAIPAFFYYSIINSGNGNRTWASSGVIDINNTFTPGTGTHTITGSSVRYSATAAATYTLSTFTTNITTPARQYNNLEIGGGASTIWQVNAGFNLGIANNFVYSGSGAFRVTAGASSNTMTVDGTLTQSGTGTLRVSGSATSAITGTLNVTGNATLSAGILEVVGTSAATAHGALSTNDLTISGTGQLVLEVTAGTTGVATVTVNGDLLVTSTTTNAINIGASTGLGNNQIALKGDFTKSGTGTLGLTGSATSTAGYTFSGTGTQSFSHSGTAMSSGNFTVANGSVVQLLTNMTLGSASASALNVAGTLDAGNFQVISGFTSDQFTLNATGTLKMNSATGVVGTISGFTISPAFTSGGTFEFTGTNVNTGFSTFANISATYTITWTGSGSLTLDKNIDLTNFNFTNSGLVYLGNFNMTISATGGVTGGSFSSSKMIVTNGTGILIRNVSSGGTGIPFTWPIGEVTGSAEYSPVTIPNISVSIAGTIGFTVTDGVHPSMGAASSYLSRYWEYTVTGLGTYNWTNATFTYTAGDIVVGPETSLKANVYNSGTAAWVEFATSSAASNVLTFTSGATQTTMASGNEITGRIDVPVYYQTVGAGPSNWSSTSTWEASLSPAFTSPFTPSVAPSYANSALIKINAGHTVTVTASTTADDLEINGTVDVSGGTTVFTVFNGTASTDATIASTGTLVASTNSTSLTFASGTSTSVSGLLKLIGTSAGAGSTITNSGTIVMNNGSTYEHARDAGTLTMGGTVTWSAGSTCKISGLTLNIPSAASFAQSFSNVVFANTAQTATLNTSGNLTSVSGKLRIASTGSGILRLAAGQTYSLTIGDSLIVEAGTLDLVSGAGNATVTVNGHCLQSGGAITKTGSGAPSVVHFNGDFIQNAGTFEFGIAGSPTSVVNLKGNFVHNGGITRGSGTGTFNFIKGSGGTQTWSQSGGTVSGAITWNVGSSTTNTVQLLSNVSLSSSAHTFNVTNGATFDMGPYVLSGTKTAFNLNATGAIKSGHASGIVTAPTASGNVQTLTRTFPGTATYYYNGAADQVTGNALPTTLTSTGNLNIQASSGITVTLTNNNTTTPTFNLISGLFAAGNTQQLNITNNGTVNATGGDWVTGVNAGLLNFPGNGTFTGSCNPYNVYASGGVNFGSGTVTIQNGGRFRINIGGYVNTNAPFYATGSLLQYYIGSTYGRNLEWSAASGRGYPHHVQLSNSTTLDGGNGGSSVALPISTSGDVTIDSGSSLYLDFGGNNVTQDFVIAGNLTFIGNMSWSQASGADVYLGGNFNNNGVSANLFSNNRALFMNGGGTQTIGGSYPLTFIFPYLLIDKTAGSVVLARDVQVSNTLTFTASNTAILDASTYTLYVTNNATGAINRTGLGHVNGSLRRAMATGSNTYSMTIGDATVYAPITIDANSVSVAGSMTASTTSGDHSQIATSGLDATQSVNRVWTLSQTGLTLTNYDATLGYDASDLDGGATYSNFIVGRYSSGWTYPTVGTLAATSTEATGLTAYGEFAVAECKTPDAYNVTGSGSYCAGGSGLEVELDGSDSWISYQLQRNGTDTGSPVIGTGSSISFGFHTLAGTYTVIATNLASGSCTASMTGSAVIVVTPNTPVDITIASSLGNVICAGTTVNFTATAMNPGSTPVYQWQINGSSVATGSSYSTSSLSNGDLVTCILYSSETCPLPIADTSNTIAMTVYAIGTPVVSVSIASSTICAGENAVFTATPTFGGSTPVYQWRLNGSNVGTNSNTYSNPSLVNGDQIDCIMTSNYPCLTAPDDTSTVITMTIIAAPVVDAGTDMSTCGLSAYTFANGATNVNTTGIVWTETGAGSITAGSTTLTPTYTPAAGDIGTSVKFYLTGTGNSPCTTAIDSVYLAVAALQLWYVDADGDGFGNPLSSPTASCTQPSGRVLDNTDCCDTNADINPMCEWWADIDGDGYGSFIYTNGCISGCSGNAQTYPWYPPAHGGALYSMDCNDNDVNAYPGASEICQNSADDDCDLTIDEGCSGIINDTWANAITLNVQNPNMWYPNCNIQNGTLVNADISIEANPSNVNVGGGRDIWYRFQAPSTGVQIRVVPTGFDAVIELRTAAHPTGQVDVESINNTVGGAEILNSNALTIGQVYYVGVRNKDNTNVGTFTLCVSPLMPSGCASVEPTGGYSICSNFKATFRGALNYTFNFTGTGGTAAFPFVTTAATSTGLMPLGTSALDIRYGGEYSARVDANYQLYNGLNAAEAIITIQGSNSPSGNCTDIDIITAPLSEVKSTQRCPAILSRNSYLIATPVVVGANACGAVNYTFRFTQISACGAGTVGLPFTVTTPTNTPYLSLLLAFPTPSYPLANMGKWRVEVRPNFSYGSGAYGPAQDIQVNNTSLGAMSPDDNDLIEAERGYAISPVAMVYPNPSTGEEVTIVVNHLVSENIQVRITDAAGRLVYNRSFIADGILNTNLDFTEPLSAGIYFVQITTGDWQDVQQLFIER
ncbi:MAG: T9SS type A sorting domain-containing protein [Flavobacteriales bacterium]|nr:T9SS type A sorting domain-containing protein [Flavobacteriales bacterium]